MTPSTKAPANALRAALAIAASLLLATPALADVPAAEAAPSTAAGVDGNRIGCWATAYGNPARDSGVLNLIGHFGTKCDSAQSLNPDPIEDDPVPPTVQTRIIATVEYCTHDQRCLKRYTGDSDVLNMPPSKPSGFWLAVLDYFVEQSCKTAMRGPLAPFDFLCEASTQHWAHETIYSIGDHCYADCREGGRVTYRATHYISIPSGTGYHLEPGLFPRTDFTANSGCVSVDLYHLTCESVYEGKASSPPPTTVVLPPAIREPVEDAERECEERMGEPACNP